MSYFMVLLMSFTLVSCASYNHQPVTSDQQEGIVFDGQSISFR